MEVQKAARASCAQAITRLFDNEARAQLKYMLTGDDSWMHYDQFPTKMLTLDRVFVDQRVRPTNYRRKTMITVFSEPEGIMLLAVLHQGWKITSVYFQEHILRELAVQKHARGRKSSTACYTLHFDEAPLHNTEEVQQTFQE
jgi:ribulose bisphosphate carboxylase small subunit